MYCYHRWVKRELHCSSRRLLRETDKELLPVLWAYFPLLHICRQFGEEKLHSRFVQNQGAVEISERQNPSCPSFSWLWWVLYAELVHHSCTLLKCRNCWCTGFKVPFFCALFLQGKGEVAVRENKAGVWVQKCTWGGAMLILFSALSSWGVWADLSRQPSRMPYVSWRCLSSGLFRLRYCLVGSVVGFSCSECLL